MVEGMLGRIGRRDVLAIAVLGLVALGIPLWLSAAAGAIGVPGNDAWVYMRGADSLYRTGSIDMPGHTAAAIGQIVMVQPLLWLPGGNPWAYTAFGLVMALIGVAATYLLARRFVGTGSAVLVVLLVVAFPGFARESASFMTDVPAYALVMLCLLLGTRWLQGDGGRATLVASLAAGVLGVSIREFAIAAPSAILVAAWARNRADERAWLAVVSGLFAAGVVGVLIISASTPGNGGPPEPLDIRRLIINGPIFTTLAAVLLPAIIVATGRRMATFSPRHLILGAGLACLLVVTPAGPFIGNTWMLGGLGGDAFLSGSRDPVMGDLIWALSGQLAVFAAILGAALAVRWAHRYTARVDSRSTAMGLPIRIARSSEAPLVLFLAAYAAGLVVYALFGRLLDRYLYPMVPAAAILLLRGFGQASRLGRSRALSHTAFAWLLVSAFVIAANSFAYDAARWRAGEGAVAMGYDARTVDAGYEWVGFHATSPGSPGSGPGGFDSSNGATWYKGALTTVSPCAVLSNTPLDDIDVRLISVDRSAYRQYLFFGPAEPLYLYGVLADGCPQPPVVAVITEP